MMLSRAFAYHVKRLGAMLGRPKLSALFARAAIKIAIN